MKFWRCISAVFYFLALICFVLSYFKITLGFDYRMVGMSCLGIASLLLLTISLIQINQNNKNQKKKKKRR